MAQQKQKNQPEPLPVWLSIPIILVCLVGGGWIVHWYVMTDPVSHEAKILGAPPPPTLEFNRGNGGLGGGRNRFRSVEDNRNGNWTIHTEQASADLTISETGKLYFRSADYNGNYGFVPEEIRDTIFKARQIVTDKDPTRLSNLKLPADQVKKLHAVSVNRIFMQVSAADKALLVSDLEAIIKLPESQRQNLKVKLEQTMDEVADRSRDATRQEAVNRANQINSILTPALWKLDAEHKTK